MADRRSDREQDRRPRRDLETERRIERLADRYRGSDERGYGGGEHLGRDWEREPPRGGRGLSREEHLHSMDEERYERDLREAARDRDEHRFRDMGRDLREDSDYGQGHHRHHNLAALYDLDDLSELRERYRGHRHGYEDARHYGHGPGIENMEAPRLGYGTGMTRRDNTDHDLGHGGFIGEEHGMRSPRPTGRGPKGYQRSDERIREDICDRLMMSWMNSENVDVRVREGEVTLQGTVKSRDEKRAIEALAESVLGVKDIINALRVDRGERMSAEARPEPPGDRPLHS